MAPLPGIKQYSFGNRVINLYMSFWSNKFYGVVAGDRKNLVINILTKEGNASLDIMEEK